MENEIKLVQEPIIKHELIKAGLRVTERLAELDLENQIATIESLKYLKKLRAELNNEFKDYEEQRKLIKNALLNPYNELEEIYKPEISEKYKNADEILKDKIASVENGLKEEKEANLKVYFIELCQSEEVDFITFDRLELDINLSTNEKKYKEQINEFMQRICSDVDLIDTLEHKAEIMAQYKLTLNASESIKQVNDRKEREEQERIRIKKAENLQRFNLMKNIGMQFDEMTKSFVYNDDIYISESVLYELDKSEFRTKFIEFEEKIKSIESEITEVEFKEEKTESKEQKQEIKEPLKAPKKEEKIELVTAQFEATATYPQLKALGQYMKDNNIKYKNI